jgi:autotransporter-associated beta strand protein
MAETINLEGGSVEVNVQDNTTNWNVTGNPVWNVPEFNIPQNNIYNISGISQNASLALLVNGGQATNIFGTMNLSNLDFILQNIAGINIGSTGMINLNNASLIASTLPLNLSVTDFLAHDYQFSGQGGFLMNDGKIVGNNADLVALVANALENKGTIEVPMGTVTLAAGNTVTVGISPDGFVSIGVDEATANQLGLTSQITNSGTIRADGGRVVLNAQAVDGLFEKAICIEKSANATSVIKADNGIIEFKSKGGVSNAGVVEANKGSIKVVSQAKDVVNQGTIKADEGKIEVVSEQGKVTNEGTMSAVRGTVKLTAEQAAYNKAVLEALYGKIEVTVLKVPEAAPVSGSTGSVMNQGTMDATGGSIEINASGVVESTGAIRAARLYEQGYTFRSSGYLGVTDAYFDNVDLAADLEGDIDAGTYNDVNFNVIGDLTLLGHVTWNASGSFNMASDQSLDGGGFNATISAAGASTLGNISNVGTLSVGGSGNIDAAGELSGSLNLIKTGSGTLTLSGNNSYTGLTTVSAGMLKLGAAGDGTHGPLGTTDAGTVVSAGAVLDLAGHTLSTSEALTLNGTGISSNGALMNSGAAATYSGLISLGSTGVSIVGGAGSIALSHLGTILGAGYALILGGAQGGSVAGIIGTGTGTLTKSGAGTWTLSGDNTYTGATTVSGGMLNVGSGSTSGRIAGSSIVNNAALTFDRSDELNYAGVISGTGTVTKAGAGALTLSGNNTYAGTTTINDGTLKIGAGETSGAIAGASIINNAALVFDRSDALSYSGVISGTGTVTKAGEGALTLSGNNSYSGLTTISEGTLKIGAAGSGSNGPLGTTAGGTVIADGATLDLNGYTLVTAEPLTLNGTGIANGGALSNSSATAATYSGLVTLGSASSIVASNGDIIISNAGTITGNTYGLTLGGSSTGSSLASGIGTTSGTLAKEGSGTWTLSGTNTYTGVTTISAGTLQMAKQDSLYNHTPSSWTADNIIVEPGATLAFNVGGTGEFTSSDINILKTLGTASGGFKSGSFLGLDTTNFAGGNFTYSGVIADTNSGANMLGVNKLGSNTLTLSGNNSYSGLTTISAGTLKLGTAGSGSHSPLGTVASGTVVSAGATLDLNGYTIVNEESLTLNGTGISSGGALSNNSTNTAIWNGLISLGSASSIVAGIGNILISNPGTIIGETYGLTLGGVTTGNSIASIIGTTTGGVTKIGTGTWTLTGANTYTGGTTIGTANGANAGTLMLSGSGTLGSGAATVYGGTLDLNGTTQTMTALSLGGGAAGSSAVVSIGNGTLNLGGNVTYSSANNPLGASITGAGGGVLNLNGTRTFTVNDSTAATNDLTISALIQDGSVVSGLTKAGAGALILTEANNYAGLTTINAGTLKLGTTGSGGNTPLGTVDSGTVVSAGGNLDLNGYTLATDEALTLNGTGISGGGALSNSSATGVTYSGLITLGSASSIVGTGNILISNAGTITGAYSLTLGGTAAGSSIASIIGTEAGGLAKIGTGSWTLSGANTYTGATTIGTSNGANAGALLLSGSGTIGNGAVTVYGGTLNLNGTTQTITSLTLGGGATGSSAVVAIGSGTLNLNGNVTYSSANNPLGASITGTTGALNLNGTRTFTVNDSTAATNDLTISANIQDGSVASGLDKAGAGMFSLSGTNTYTGATVINAGVLQVAKQVSLYNNMPASWTADNIIVESGATLNFNVGGTGEFSSSDIDILATLGTASGGFKNGSYIGLDTTNASGGNFTYSSVIADTNGGVNMLGLNKLGANTLTLSGNNSYSGLTTISAGTLKLGAAGSGANTPLGTVASGTSITAGAALDLNGYTLATAEPLTLRGTGISSGGALSNSSATGVTYSGLITLGSASSIVGVGDIIISNAGTITGAYGLTLGGTAAGSRMDSVIGTGVGGLAKIGAGTWTLTGANTYTGGTTVGTANGANAGTLLLSGSGTIGSGAATVYGGTLDLNGSTQTVTALSLGGGAAGSSAVVSIGSGVLSLGGNVTYTATNNPLGASITGTGGGVLNMNGTRTFTVNDSTAATNDLTISAIIQDGSVSSGVTKVGAGALILSGANTYTGAITVGTSGGANAGTLRLGGVGTVNNDAATVYGGTLDLNGTTLNITNLTLGGGATGSSAVVAIGSGTLNLNGNVTYSSANNPLGASITGTTGALSLNGTRTFTVNDSTAATNDLTISANIQDGSVTSGLTKSGAGALSVSGTNTYTGATMVSSGVLQMAKQVSLYNHMPASWTADNIIVESGATLNFNVGGTGEFIDADIDIFATLGTASGGFKNGSYLGFDTTNAAGGFTYVGDIADTNGGVNTLGINKLGANTLTLSGDNTYTGTTAISAGTLSLGYSGALGSISTISFLGGTLQFSAANTSDYSGRFSTAAGQAYRIDTNGQDVTFANPLTSSSGTLTKLGAGTLTLTGVNTYTGATAIGTSNGADAGTLLVSGSGTISDTVTVYGGTLDLNGTTRSITTLALGGGAAGSSAVVSIGSGVLNLNGNVTYTATNNPLGASITASEGGVLNLNATRTFTINDSTAAASDLTISAVIQNGSGASGLIKAGAGTLTLSGSNTYTGATSIQAGTVSVSSIGSVGSASSNLGAPASIAAGTLAIGSGATGAALQYTGTGETTDRVINLAGTTGGAVLNHSGTGLLKFTSNLTATGAGAKTLTIQSSTSGTGEITGTIVNGSGTTAVTKSGAGTWVLSGNNTYTGLTTVSGGTLQLGASGSGANSPLGTVASGTVVAAGATLDLNGYTLVTAEPLTLNGTGISNGGALSNSSMTATNWKGLVALGSASSIVADSGDIIISNTGTISGATFGLTLGGTATGSLIASTIGTTSGALTKEGAGTWTLYGNNTYTGLTTISGGTLRLGVAGSGTYSPLGTVANGTSVMEGATLDLNGFTLPTAEALTLRGTGISGSGALMNSGVDAAIYSGLITLASAEVSIVGDTGTIALSHVGTIMGSGYNLTLGGAQGGSLASVIETETGTLTKTGAGTWTLTGNNTFSGGTVLNAGTLNINHAGALGTGTFTIDGGTIDNTSGSALTLSNNNVQVWNGNFTFAGTYDLDMGTGAVTLGGDIQVAVTARTLTVDAIGDGTYSLTKTGAGRLATGAVNANDFTLTNGSVVLGGDLDVAGGLNIGSSATLDLAGNNITTTADITNDGTLMLEGGENISDADVTNHEGSLVQYYGVDGPYDLKVWAYYDLTLAGNAVYTVTPGVMVDGVGRIIESAKVARTVSATGEDKVYDGNSSATVILSLDSNAFDDWYAVAPGSYTATFDSKDVGSGKTVSVDDIALSGADTDKFLLMNTTAFTTADITAKIITLSGITAAQKVYDGTTSATVSAVGATFDGVIAGDEVTVESSTGAFVDKNVGIGKMVSLINSFGGADLGNYQITDQGTAAADITAKAVTLSGITASNKVYDATTRASVSTAGAIFDGTVAGDELTVESSAGTFSDKNVGTAKTVTLVNTFGGADAGNYTITDQGTISADITARALTVTATGVNKYFDGTPAATVRLSDNRVAGDAITDSYLGAFFEDEIIGSNKVVTVTGISISGADALNYTLMNTTAVTTADITAAPPPPVEPPIDSGIIDRTFNDLNGVVGNAGLGVGSDMGIVEGAGIEAGSSAEGVNADAVFGEGSDGVDMETVMNLEGEGASERPQASAPPSWRDVPIVGHTGIEEPHKFLTDVRVLQGAVYVIDGYNAMSLLGVGDSLRVFYKRKKVSNARLRPLANQKTPVASQPVAMANAAEQAMDHALKNTALEPEVAPAPDQQYRKSAAPVVMKETESGMRYGTLKNPGKNVFVKSTDGEWKPAADGMVILPGDEVRTAADNSVEVLMDGGKIGRVEVKEGSLFRIQTAEKDPETGDDRTMLDLAIGKILVKVESLKGNSKFEVRTPTALTGVRGTVFEVTVKEKT